MGQGVEEVVNKEKVLESEEPETQTTTDLQVEQNALNYAWESGIYDIEPQVKRFQNISVAERATHFWWKGIPVSEILWRVDYMGVQEIVIVHSDFKKCSYECSTSLRGRNSSILKWAFMVWSQ